MRNILIHADADPAMATRIESALIIARRFGSHLSFVISSPFRQFIASDPFGGMYLAKEHLAKAQLADLELHKELEVTLSREGVPWDVAIADGDALSTLALAGTLADLIILSLGVRDGRGHAQPTIAGDLALTVPVPVLALPADGKPIDLDAPAMIAWNGSPQAAHALRTGLPLLGDAKNVVMVMIGDDEGGVSAEDALRYMSRHGVHGELRREARGRETPEEMLLAIAKEMAPGLIIMGAFGRRRLRETLFGGVTRYLLETSPTPLLLAH